MRKFGVHAGGPSRGRLLVVSIAALAMLSPLGVVSSAQATVAKASPPAPAAAAMAAPSMAFSASSRIRLSPSITMASEWTKLTGKLPTAKSRRVVMQQKIGTRWVTTTIKTRTTRTGAYVFRIVAYSPGSYRLRVLAPRVKVAGRVKARYVTASRTLRVVR